MALTKIDDRGLKTPIDLLDNEKIRFGTGNDLELYHDGSNNNIKAVNGHLNLYLGTGKSFSIGNSDFTEDIFRATENGAVSLYYDSSKKLETTANGINLSGRLVIADSDGSETNMIRLGGGADLKLYHSSNISTIKDDYGDLRIMGNTIRIQRNAGGENFLYATEGGKTSLYYDGTERIETTSTGITVSGSDTTGTIVSGAFALRDVSSGSNRIEWIPGSPYGLRWGDNYKAIFGSGNDLEVYHDGSNSWIKDTGTGNLNIATSAFAVKNAAANENMIVASQDGNVELYYDNAKKFETTSDGALVTGKFKSSAAYNVVGAEIVGGASGYSDPLIVKTSNDTVRFTVNGDGIATATDYVGDYPLNNRNLYINGDMRIAQRSTSATGITGNGYHFIDRTHWSQNGATVTLSQSTTVPSGAGFKYSAKMETTTAAGSIAAGNVLRFAQAIEGQDVARLKYGNAAAESLAISFWARSSQTGVFVTTLKHGSRIVSEKHTISNADTWVKYTWIVPGDTSTALTNTDHQEGLAFYLYVSSGTNTNSGAHMSTWGGFHNSHMAQGNTLDCLTNANATFYLTGVQIEVGEVVTPYEHISYADQLLRCQRYHYVHATGAVASDSHVGMSSYYNSTILMMGIQFPVNMRVKPTFSHTSGTNYYRNYANNGNDQFNGYDYLYSESTTAATIQAETNTSGTAGHSGRCELMNSASKISFSAEF